METNRSQALSDSQITLLRRIMDREPIEPMSHDEMFALGAALVRIQNGTGTVDDVRHVANSPVTDALGSLLDILFAEIDRLRAENEQLKVQVVFLRDELQQERESRNIPF